MFYCILFRVSPFSQQWNKEVDHQRTYPEFPISPLLDHSSDVCLNIDDGPHLPGIDFPDEVASASCLKSHDVATKVFEFMREYPGPDQGLESHVARPHLLVLSLPVVRSEVLLNGDRSRSHSEEASPMIPAPDASLNDQDLFGQDPIALLLQEQVLSILEEHFRPSQLVIGFAQHDLTYLGRISNAVVLEIGKNVPVNVTAI